MTKKIIKNKTGFSSSSRYWWRVSKHAAAITACPYVSIAGMKETANAQYVGCYAKKESPNRGFL